MALINLLVIMEAKISEAFRQEFAVVGDEALAREPSPLATAGTFIDYLAERLKAEGLAPAREGDAP
jgi:hypothetical protein